MFAYPRALTIDAAGNIFVADSDNAVVRKITPNGTVSTVAGAPGEFGSVDGPAATARFGRLYGITTDALGSIYVTDDNKTIRKITPDGLVSTIAGIAGRQGSTDGDRRVATFGGLVGVAVDASGVIFVADMWNNSIRRVGLDGDVSTFAGANRIPGGRTARARTPDSSRRRV